MLSALLSVAIIAAPLAAVASPHDSHAARHHDIAKRMAGDLEKRGSSRWSFYDVGLGACGKTNVASDFIVAMNSDEFDQGSGYPNSNCWKMITMSYKGKTTQAQIVDRCPGCGPGGYDLSRGLFTFFASEDEGIIYGDVSIGGSGGGNNNNNNNPKPTTQDKPKDTPKPSPEPKPSPTTTWKPEPTTTTTPKVEEKKTSSSSSSSSSSAKPSSSKASSSSAKPSSSASAKATPSGTVESFNEIYMEMANLMFAAYKN